jgi:hypothetical protein
MAVKIDVVAKAGAFGQTAGPWTWNVANQHLFFHSFGDGTALDPMLTTQLSSTDYLLTHMHGRMRPCWPYTDAVTYRLTWNDGAVTTFTAAPGAVFTQDHHFGGYGHKVVKLEALHDAAGRDLTGATTERNVFLFPARVQGPFVGDLQLAQ